MASIYQDPRTGIWYLNYTIDGKRVRKSLGTRDRKLAELALKQVEVELAKGRLGFVADTTLSEFADKYLQWSKAVKAKKTYETELNALNKLMEYMSPTIKLSKITKQKAEGFKVHLINRGYAKTYINIILRHLKAVFYKAVEWNNIAENPFRIPLLKTEERIRYLTPEQLQKFFLSVENPLHKAIFELLFYTGMRISEACHLLKEQVDLENGYIYIKNRIDYRTKTYRERVIPIHEALKPALNLLLSSSGEKLIPFSYYYVMTLFKRYSKKAGMHCTPHMLRHTFATLLASKGVSVKAIQELLGHASVKTTEIYAKFVKDYLKDAIDKLQADF